MPHVAFVLVLAAVFAWGALSAQFERADLTAPIAFVALGVVLHATGAVPDHVEAHAVKALTEITLVWLLFSDASRVDVRELRADDRVYLGLLGGALPVTVLLGWLVAVVLLPGTDTWLALLVGAALAPTDAALSGPVISNLTVPARTRSILNVESGLNDGIVTPVVVVAIAGAAAGGQHSVSDAVLELLIGAAIGAAIGLLGGWTLRTTRARGWVDDDFLGPAMLALPLLAYVSALGCGGNGFVAAFVAGLCFGRVSGSSRAAEVEYVQQTGTLASLLVWLLVGVVAVPVAVDAASWQLLAYAVLSLTVVRMIPAGAVILATGMGRSTALFIGWFGPRGLASVVFALLAVEELHGAADPAVAAIAFTVVLSVVAHGLTAAPLAARYGARHVSDSTPA